MLISGDLVRIPQGTVINEESEKPLPLPIAIIATPAMGIVLESRDEMVKVLMDGEVIYVEKKYLQLVGGN
jgi:hypothetical protein